MSVTSSRIVNLRRWLRPMLPLRNWTAQASIAHWLYVFGFFFGSFYIVLFFMMLFLQHQQMPLDILWYISGGAFALGFVHEANRIIVLVWKHTVVKWILSGVMALWGFIATVLAKKLINITVLLDPSLFPMATVALTGPTAIVVGWVLALFISVFLYMFMPLFEGGRRYGLDHLSVIVQNNIVCRFFLNRSKLQTPHKTVVNNWFIRQVLRFLNFAISYGRVMGPLALSMGLMFGFIHFSSTGERQLSRTIATTIVLTEYYPLSTCSNHRSGEWVSFIGSDKISVATPDQVRGYVFEVRPCDS